MKVNSMRGLVVLFTLAVLGTQAISTKAAKPVDVSSGTTAGDVAQNVNVGGSKGGGGCCGK